MLLPCKGGKMSQGIARRRKGKPVFFLEMSLDDPARSVT